MLPGLHDYQLHAAWEGTRPGLVARAFASQNQNDTTSARTPSCGARGVGAAAGAAASAASAASAATRARARKSMLAPEVTATSRAPRQRPRAENFLAPATYTRRRRLPRQRAGGRGREVVRLRETATVASEGMSLSTPAGERAAGRRLNASRFPPRSVSFQEILWIKEAERRCAPRARPRARRRSGSHRTRRRSPRRSPPQTPPAPNRPHGSTHPAPCLTRRTP